jgi:cytochrome b subunit of formate dehydrogenase
MLLPLIYAGVFFSAFNQITRMLVYGSVDKQLHNYPVIGVIIKLVETIKCIKRKNIQNQLS